MKKALVIDDNRETADALVMMLEMLGIEGRAAYGPSPAMTLLNTSIPDIVLLDINMPGVDGVELLGYLRREPKFEHIPVIIITSDDQEETRRRVMAGGAQAMIIKPPLLNQLEEALKKAAIL